MPRPTILVGHGDFGHDALQRLLANAALRGVLPWTRRPQGGPGAGERQLRDFALLWVPERPGPGPVSGLEAVAQHHLPDPTTAATTPEFLKDIYRQIIKVAPEGKMTTSEQALAAAAEEAKRALLSPEARQERGSGGAGGVHGLDLILLARPGTAASMGQVDNLLRASLRPLWEDPTLRRVGKEGQVVNCIALLDFDDFWAREDATLRLRRALVNSARTWERCDADRPGPGRIYLLDTRTEGAQRNRDARLDEATLFLEFLLFEGQRSELDWLFRRSGGDQPVLAAFGIRLLERSPALLGRIAAARFGQEWLPYLAGDKPPNFPALRVRRALAPLREGPDAAPGADDPLAACWRERADALVAAVMALPGRDAPDWAHRARDCFRHHCRNLELALAGVCDTLADELRREHLQRGDKVKEAIAEDLHGGSEPTPLASVEAEIDAALADLEPTQGAARRPRRDDGPVGLPALHARFLAQIREWIGSQGRALWPFWAGLGALLGLSLTPFAHAFLISLPEPDPLAETLHRLHTLSQWLAEPAPLAFALATLGGLLLAWPLGRAVQRRIARACNLYLDPEAGHFATLIRAQDDPLAIYLESARADLAATRAAEATQILGEIRERLAERRRELGWLRTQLGELLRMHGQHPEPAGGRGRPRRPQLSVRQWIEAPGDLERMLRANPITEERLRAYQENLLEPFQSWAERAAREEARAQGRAPGPCRSWADRYCDAFLDPLELVAHLGRGYVKPFENALEDPDSAERELRQAALGELLQRPDFSLAFAFAFATAEETPMSRRYCVIPESWLLQGETRRILDHQGKITDPYHGQDPTRVYLFEAITGVPTACLGE